LRAICPYGFGGGGLVLVSLIAFSFLPRVGGRPPQQRVE
jgi:hypothetical protein